MREVNFSLPSANKASVGITAALYDRRALDTTSTLPLINSLNNLAYLTTSSVRIRDILTVDGGIERLVCILKEGRSTALMDSWKWNLAFQCLVNIGVRGTEPVRTRLVEADMVPVIATILENYIQVTDLCHAKIKSEIERKDRSSHSTSRPMRSRRSNHTRATPSVDILPTSHPSNLNPTDIADVTMTDDAPLNSVAQRPSFQRHSHSNSAPSLSAIQDTQRQSDDEIESAATPTATPTATLNSDNDQESLAFRPGHNIGRLPSMIPLLQAEFAQPESPLTPNGIPTIRTSPTHTARRPSIRHQLSISNSDIVADDDLPLALPNESTELGSPAAVALQDDMVIPTTDDVANVTVENVHAESTGQETLDMARHELENGPNSEEILPHSHSHSPSTTHAHTHSHSHTHTPTHSHRTGRPTADNIPNPYIQFYQERPGPISCMPRDEDILMCLQLLAYVSKYCSLRGYFQATHTVPRLKIPRSEIEKLKCELGGHCLKSDCAHHQEASMLINPDDESMEEYLLPDNFNIFPLVEMFTLKHYNADFQYWSRVVMRNLCRKDESRGNIRQCAFWQCGKWEKYVREFAKCRRCRRTKYCSKDCQKKAWAYHRHWCVEASQERSNAQES